jgi:hypothetical protein
MELRLEDAADDVAYAGDTALAFEKVCRLYANHYSSASSSGEAGLLARVDAALEGVMNSIRNGLGMRKTGDCGGPSQPENPHANTVFTQVHNTL